MAEFSLKLVYFPDLRNLVEKSLNRQPDAVGYPDDVDIGGSGIGLHVLQDPIVFAAVKD